MSRKLLEKVSNTPVAAVQRNRSKTPFKPKPRPQSGTRGSSLAQVGSVASVDLRTHQESAQPMVRYATYVKVGITFGRFVGRLSLNLKVTLSIGHLGKTNMRLEQNMPPIIKVILSLRKTVYR